MTSRLRGADFVQVAAVAVGEDYERHLLHLQAQHGFGTEIFVCDTLRAFDAGGEQHRGACFTAPISL